MADKKKTVNAENVVKEEENVIETTNTENALQEAANTDLPATEENAPEYTYDTLPEEVRDLVWPMIQSKRAMLDSIGDKGLRLEEAKASLLRLEEAVKIERENVRVLTEQIAVPQIRISQMDRAIKDLLAPVTLKARAGVVRVKEASTGPSDRALNSALETLSKIGTPDSFTAQDLMAAKGCGRDTAGGILHRWENAGIIERKSVGVYGIAAQYAGLV